MTRDVCLGKLCRSRHETESQNARNERTKEKRIQAKRNKFLVRGKYDLARLPCFKF